MPDDRDELDLFSGVDSPEEKVEEVQSVVMPDAPDAVEVVEEPAASVVVDDRDVAPHLPEDDLPGGEAEKISSCPLPMPDIETLEEFGNYLRRVREKKNISLESVAAETKIKVEYIKALENGDSNELPPGVFVLAYARRLCRIYGIDPDGLGNVFELLRNAVSYELPNDLTKVIGNGEIDEAELRRRNHLAIAFVSLFSLIVLALVAGIIVLVMFLNGRQGGPLTESEIIRLQGPATLEFDRLPPKPGKTGQKR